MLSDALDDYPVRDWPDGKNPAVQQRRVIEKWAREDIEDNYLKLYSENVLLKQHGRKQEDKIKKLATKLLKLSNDNKKLKESSGVGSSVNAAVSRRDFDLQEKVEDLNLKILDLNKENNLLKDKLAVAKQQLSAQGKKNNNTAYSYINHRIDTGRGMKPDGLRTTTPPRALNKPMDTQPRYGHSLLEDARDENVKLHDALVIMEEKLQDAERECDHLRDQLRQQQNDKNEGLVKYRDTMNSEQKSGIQENVEIIKLQREVKDKSTRFTSLQLQYQTLEDNLRSVKSTNQQLLAELERLNKDLQDEHSRTIDLQSKLRDDMSREKTLLETKHRLQLLEQENNLLKSNNESLMTTALSTERDSAALEKEKQLRLEIAKLQAALKGDLNDKGEILDKYHAESESHEKLKAELRTLQIEYYTIRQKYETAQEKVNFFTSQSSTEYAELEEALALIKSRKSGDDSNRPDFIENVDDKATSKKLMDLEAQFADTVAELEKSRNMLLQQYNINRVYKKEVDTSTHRLEEYKKEFESRAEEYAHLLDIRQARIKKLEAQLRDVAYGTKSVKITNEKEDEDDEENLTLPVDMLEMERGKNIFEINIDRVNITAEAQAMLGDSQPSLFVTYGFHEFETQSTPVCKGPSAVFKFTSQYTVDMDDTFLHHLMKSVTEFELHQAIGTDFRTLASANISFNEIFENPKGRLYASTSLVGKSRDGLEVVGTVEYSIRFIVPVEQALRLYRERVKALGYSQANAQVDSAALRILEGEETVEPGMNHLYVKIERCTDLNAVLPDRQPSPYVVYKFFDFDDYDTPIIANSCNPEFSDNKSFKVEMNDNLDNHLKSTELDFFVFDDSQEKGELSFLGVARVPLVELSHNKPIRGPYQISLPDGRPNGTIVISLKWFADYKTEHMIRGAALQLIAEREKEEDELATLARTDNSRSRGKQSVTPELLPMNKASRPSPRVQSKVEPESIRAPEKFEGELVANDKHTENVFPSGRSKAVDLEIVSNNENVPVNKSSLRPTLEEDSESELFDEPKPEMAAPKSILKIRESGEFPDPGEVDPNMEVRDSEAEEPVDEVIEASDADSTDSEMVVSSKTMRSSVTFDDDPNSITVAIHSVTLEHQCKAIKNASLAALFVSYKFLDIPLDLTETPNSLAKPNTAGESVMFNFHKTFPVDEIDHASSREALKEMFVAGQPPESCVRFDVVAEPNEEEGDCEDVGFVEVDIVDMARTGKDIIEQEMDLRDARTPSLLVGSMKLTLRGSAAFRSVYGNLKDKKSRINPIGTL